MQNVCAQGIDGDKLKQLIERTAQYGHEAARPKNDPRGGSFIDDAFDEITTGANGQNGIRLFVDEFGNLKSAQPENVW
ncbi:hypothetical protein [Streptomyces sp. NPDC059466]|uniref:hypothetical protein n=1 Tax=unclassified Streptomyces TaxID=2593676 RepID=UPI0036A26542